VSRACHSDPSQLLGPSLRSGPPSRREREPKITISRQPKLLRVAPLSVVLALAGVALAPAAPAAAQCPGCDEYTLDIPNPGGNQSANPSEDPSTESEAPAPAAPVAPAPVPAAPTYPDAPATGATYDETAPVPIVPQAPGIRERRGPRLPVTMRTIAPHDPVAASAQRPILPAAAGEPPDGGSTLPLFGVMGAIAIAGAALALARRHARAGRAPGRLAPR
jgi:hypothetical protein